MSDFTADPTAASTPMDTVLDVIKSNIQLLRVLLADTNDPASPLDYERWIRSNVPEEPEAFIELPTGGKTRILLLYKLLEALDCNLQQLNNLALEKLTTGTLPAVNAANNGRLSYNDTIDRAVLNAAATRAYLAQCQVDGANKLAIPCDLNVLGLGTPATASTATDRGGWLLDAAADELNVVARRPIPSGWSLVPDAGKDLTLRVTCLLANAETAGDDIDMDGDWQAERSGAAGPSSVAFAAVTKDIGSQFAQYALHDVDLVVDWDSDATNLAAGDWFKGKINHAASAAAGAVNGVIVVAAQLLVPVLNYQDVG